MIVIVFEGGLSTSLDYVLFLIQTHITLKEVIIYVFIVQIAVVVMVYIDRNNGGISSNRRVLIELYLLIIIIINNGIGK